MNLIVKIKRRLFRPSETLDGYENPELIDLIFRKTLAFEPHGDWHEIKDAATVLDFGGGAGKHYKQARSTTVRWAIVETPAMVERAKEIATDRLRFFDSIIDAASWLGDIDVMHSDGALQYTPDPKQTLRHLCDVRAKRMLWQRVLFGSGSEIQSSFLTDNGPGTAPRIKEKTVKYERSGVEESIFLAAHYAYELTARGPDWFRYSLR